MNGARWLAFFMLLSAIWIAGCGGGGKSAITTSRPGTAPVSLALTDMPPSSISLLSFRLTATGAALNPGNVSLLNTPVEFDLKRFETESLLVSTVTVPSGVYTDLTISLANPVMTFKNDSAVTVAGCLPGQVCTLTPPVAASLHFSIAPFPLTINPDVPVALQAEVNLNQVVTSMLDVDFTAKGGVSVSLSPAVQPAGSVESDDVLGVVVSKDTINRQFVLRTRLGDLLLSADSNTVFLDFDEAQLGNTFGSVFLSQILEVDFAGPLNGALLAKRVEFQDTDLTVAEVEGVIVSVDSATQFTVVAIDMAPGLVGLDAGSPLTVTIAPNAIFTVDGDGLPTSGFNFRGSRDLLVGQEVQVRFSSLAPGPPVIDRVQLKMSRFTASVTGTSAGNSFTVNNLPGLFTSARPAITQIQVQASAQTLFEGGVSGVGGLVGGDTVSVRGLLFQQTSANPVLVAEKIRKRS